MCVVSLYLTLFGSVGVSAASDNLIDSDLRTWTDASDYDVALETITVTKFQSMFRLTLPVSSSGATSYFGAILDNTSLTAGHSYTLSFRMPNTSEISAAIGSSYSDSSYFKHFQNAVILIGVGFIDSSGSVTIPDSSLLFSIDKNNYTKYVGKNLNASFVASNYTGTPCVVISIVNNNGASHVFFFENFKFIDNDDNSAELKGIKGFLHSIRWDLVGGTCDESDCPHSSNSNPHLSLTERMSSGFNSFFDDIGKNLTSLKDSFSERVGELKTSLTTLGDRMSDFFSNLGDRISGFFSNLGDRISNFFSDLKTSMSNWVSDIGDWFSELGVKITTKFQEIGDKFTEFFEKFKPRVYINLDWMTKCWIAPTNGVLYEKDNYIHNACVSDYFEIPSEYSYKLDFTKHKDFRLDLFKYTLDEKFISCDTIRTDVSEYVLESGYKYRFQFYGTANIDFSSINDLSYFCNSYLKVYADEGWLNAFLFNIRSAIKGLFVPDEGFMSAWKDNFDTLLRDHLGIIYTGGDIVSDLISTAFDIVFNAPDSFSFSIPKVEFELQGNTIHLWDSRQIDFSFMESGVFKTLYGMYTVALYIFFGVLEVKYALIVYRRMMSN